MGITKEQEEHLNKMREKNENETIFECVDCKLKLKGLINVRQHCSIYKHYSYQRPGIKGIFGFV